MGDRNEPPLQLAIDIHLTISRSGYWAGAAAVGLYALYNSSDSTKEKITSILTNSFEGFIGGRIDPEILNIFNGSLSVILGLRTIILRLLKFCFVVAVRNNNRILIYVMLFKYND